MPSTQRKPNDYWKDFANVERELREVEKKLGHFPTQKELMEMGRSSLVFAMGSYHGGVNAVRERFGLTSLQRPTGYWQQYEHVERALHGVMQQLGHFPTGRELNKLGQSGLLDALESYYGGIVTVRRRFGLSELQKPRDYWKKWENVERELQEIMQRLGHFPTRSELRKLEKSALDVAIGKYHGGSHAVRERLNIDQAKRKNGYWQDWKNVERECRALIAQYGKIPCGRTLLKLGFSGLYQAIYDLHGGMPAIKEKLGLERSEKPKRYWKKWENVERELQEIMQRLGHFPTLTELKRLGKSSLGFAMGNYHGGSNAVRKLLGKENGVKPPGYWQEWSNLTKELQQVIQRLGHFPTQRELTNLRMSSLTMAMKYHGGGNTVRLRLQQEGVLPSEQDQLEQLVEKYVGQ